jgi:hypothetical protein
LKEKNEEYKKEIEWILNKGRDSEEYYEKKLEKVA